MYIYIYIYVYKNILLCREILYATLQRCNMIFQPFFPRYYRLQGELGPGMGYGPGSWSFGMQPFVDVSFWIGKYPGNIKESLNNRFGWSLEFRFGVFWCYHLSNIQLKLLQTTMLGKSSFAIHVAGIHHIFRWGNMTAMFFWWMLLWFWNESTGWPLP